jgi:hypothetical protein
MAVLALAGREYQQHEAEACIRTLANAAGTLSSLSQ